MKTIDLSDEDFEYLRLMVRVKTNAIDDEIKRLEGFSDVAHEAFALGDEIKTADVFVLSGLTTGYNAMVRIDDALESAVDTDE